MTTHKPRNSSHCAILIATAALISPLSSIFLASDKDWNELYKFNPNSLEIADEIYEDKQYRPAIFAQILHTVSKETSKKDPELTEQYLKWLIPKVKELSKNFMTPCFENWDDFKDDIATFFSEFLEHGLQEHPQLVMELFIALEQYLNIAVSKNILENLENHVKPIDTYLSQQIEIIAGYIKQTNKALKQFESSKSITTQVLRVVAQQKGSLSSKISELFETEAFQRTDKQKSETFEFEKITQQAKKEHAELIQTAQSLSVRKMRNDLVDALIEQERLARLLLAHEAATESGALGDRINQLNNAVAKLLKKLAKLLTKEAEKRKDLIEEEYEKRGWTESTIETQKEKIDLYRTFSNSQVLTESLMIAGSKEQLQALRDEEATTRKMIVKQYENHGQLTYVKKEFARGRLMIEAENQFGLITDEEKKAFLALQAEIEKDHFQLILDEEKQAFLALQTSEKEGLAAAKLATRSREEATQEQERLKQEVLFFAETEKIIDTLPKFNEARNAEHLRELSKGILHDHMMLSNTQRQIILDFWIELQEKEQKNYIDSLKATNQKDTGYNPASYEPIETAETLKQYAKNLRVIDELYLDLCVKYYPEKALKTRTHQKSEKVSDLQKRKNGINRIIQRKEFREYLKCNPEVVDCKDYAEFNIHKLEYIIVKFMRPFEAVIDYDKVLDDIVNDIHSILAPEDFKMLRWNPILTKNEIIQELIKRLQTVSLRTQDHIPSLKDPSRRDWEKKHLNKIEKFWPDFEGSWNRLYGYVGHEESYGQFYVILSEIIKLYEDIGAVRPIKDQEIDKSEIIKNGIKEFLKSNFKPGTPLVDVLIKIAENHGRDFDFSSCRHMEAFFNFSNIDMDGIFQKLKKFEKYNNIPPGSSSEDLRVVKLYADGKLEFKHAYQFVERSVRTRDIEELEDLDNLTIILISGCPVQYLVDFIGNKKFLKIIPFNNCITEEVIQLAEAIAQKNLQIKNIQLVGASSEIATKCRRILNDTAIERVTE